MKPYSLAAPLLALAGCEVHIEDERPLSAEREERIAEIMSDEPLATAMVIDLADRLTEGSVDHLGATATNEALVKSIEHTSRRLRNVYASGQIMEADLSSFYSIDSVALYDREKTGVRKDDRIVVLADTEKLSLESLEHEAGHEVFNHDIFVADELREAGSAYNAGYADVVIEHKDYPYLLSSLYNIPGDMVRANREAIASAIEAAREKAETGDVHGAVAQLKDDLEMRSPDEAEAHIREVYGDSRAEMFEQYGASMDDVVDAYFASGMYDGLAEARQESIKEFRSEFSREATQEVRSNRH